MPATQIRQHHTCLGFLQDAKDLLIKKLLPFYPSVPFQGQTLAPTEGKNGGTSKCGSIVAHASSDNQNNAIYSLLRHILR